MSWSQERISEMWTQPWRSWVYGGSIHWYSFQYRFCVNLLLAITCWALYSRVSAHNQMQIQPFCNLLCCETSGPQMYQFCVVVTALSYLYLLPCCFFFVWYYRKFLSFVSFSKLLYRVRWSVKGYFTSQCKFKGPNSFFPLMLLTFLSYSHFVLHNF